MIKMIKYYRLKNLEQQLEELETKLINNKYITRIDLQELEGLSNEIQMLRLEMAS